ncbi:MAG: hypothetical protein KKF74_04380 [Nanoarchaeota archaeon]|nr:hypothetical protein [Nanoarchaeota archaeon]
MKQPISATIDKKLADWVNSQLKDNVKYRNKSHLIEIALQILRKEGGKNR